VIRVDGLRVRLGGRTVLDGIDFGVARGEAVALVGPNGSGKSTVLRALLGLVPFEGTVRVGGHDAAREPIEVRSLVGYLPQRPGFGDATAREALRFAARLRRVELRRADELLEQMGLARHARERARTFSGGMQQRLSLAMALLADPHVLLLDEPTASLDRTARRDFMDLLSELRRRERTLVLASHRDEEIARLTDGVLWLEEGRVVERRRRTDRTEAPATVLPFVRRGSHR
jgi:ABC-type multidrug transport system ATPase subunit